mgnify:CR=1 FL=1
MASLGLKLPIQYSSTDGFEMLKNFQRLIHQNFKMLLLTSPGERVMAPTFGVGIRNYLFENANTNTLDELRNRIYEQAIFRHLRFIILTFLRVILMPISYL